MAVLVENVYMFVEQTKKIEELKSCVILLGDETFYQDKVLAHYKKILFKDNLLEQQLNTFRYDKLTSENLFDLQENLYSCSFFSTIKLFIIRDISLFAMKKKAEEAIGEILKISEDIPEDCYLIFLVDNLDKNMRNFKEYEKSLLFSSLASRAACLSCLKLRYYEVKDWLGQEVRRRKLNFSKDAYEAILLYCNYTDNVSLSILSNEFEKIALASSPGDLISRKKLQEISQISMQVSVFRLIEYLIKKDLNNVMGVLQELMMQNVPLEATAMPLAGQLKKIIHLKKLQETDSSLTEFAKEYKLSSYLLNKLVKDTQYLTLEELKELHLAIVDFLYELRSGLKETTDFQFLLIAFC